MGTLALLGFKITLLTGLIPPIIVVIGIPNSVYMLNKYHHEFSEHGDQMKALSRIIRKVGVVTFVTNLTTAVGFFRVNKYPDQRTGRIWHRCRNQYHGDIYRQYHLNPRGIFTLQTPLSKTP